MEHTLKPYQVIAAQKKAQQWDSIPESWRISADRLPGPEITNFMHIPVTCGVLDEAEIDITSNFDATALLEELREGRLSAEQVNVAFCKRAAIAHQLVSFCFDIHLLNRQSHLHYSLSIRCATDHTRKTNCLTETFFDSAIARARTLDADRLLHPHQPLPPLFGLPISLKDSFAVAGHDTSTGLACFVDQPSATNSALVQMLLDLGAVLYCKTNLPQSILTGDSHNNVFGRTLNPRSRTGGLTAGGSSGGEGALLALRGSVLGVGTDVAGSIRVPAVCNGLYGLRASVGLVPHGGILDLQPPGVMHASIISTAGPMATTLRDVEMFMRVVMQAGGWRWDPTAISVPWTGAVMSKSEEEQKKKKLRIGVAVDDGVFTPTPPVRRGLQMVLDKLAQHPNEIELVPIVLPNIKTIYIEVVKHLALCGGQVSQRFLPP